MQRRSQAPATAASLEAVATSIDRLQRVAGRLWEVVADELDLTEVAALALVAVGEGAVTVSAVADACGRHVSTASRVVDGLVQRGLVDRREDPEDRRAVRLSLTPAGVTAAARVEESNRALLEASLAELSPADVDELARLLDELAAAAERRAPRVD